MKYDEVAPSFFKALVDTEDERFYKHLGIDPIGLFGAVKDAATHHGARGASTITQQLAKNMFRVRKNYSTGLLGKIPGLRILIMKSKYELAQMSIEEKRLQRFQDAEDECYGFINEYPDSKERSTAEHYIEKCKQITKD